MSRPIINEIRDDSSYSIVYFVNLVEIFVQLVPDIDDSYSSTVKEGLFA